MRKPPTSPVIMARVREAMAASPFTYEEIGLRMGYSDPKIAKEMAFKFVKLTRRPSAAMLVKFAFAVGVHPSRFLARVRLHSTATS